MSESDWYLIDREGRRFGPYERELIDRLAQQRELRPTTPVWHPGLARWQPADRVLKLPPETASEAASAPARPASHPPPKAPVAAKVHLPLPVVRPAPPARPSASPRTAPSARATAASGTPITLNQAVQRAFAAAFDLCVVMVVYRVLQVLTQAHVADRARVMLPLLAWGLLDAALTSRQGATPGRAMFGIEVRNTQGENLDFARALGWAAAVPVLLWLVQLRSGVLTVLAIVAFGLTLSRLRTGFAPWWDDIAAVRVRYRELSAARRVAATVATFVAALAALIAGAVA